MEKISPEDYTKAKGQLKLSLNDVFMPFHMYGQDVLINGAIEEIIELAEKFAMRCRKKDVAISLSKRRNSR